MATNNNEKIDAFLSGELSGDDQAAFGRLVKANADLGREVAFWQSLDEVLADEDTLNFQHKVVQAGQQFLHKETAPTAKVRKLGQSRRILSIAAAVLLLLAAGWFVLNNPFTTAFSGEDLYATNFETYDLDATLNRGNTINTPTVDFQTGIAQYQARDFAAAVTTFSALLTNDPGNMAITFALAQAQLNVNPPDLTGAGNLLQQVIDDGKSAYVISSHWYLALVKIQQNKDIEAMEHLKVVQQSGGKDLREKAADLLATLD